LLDPARTFIKAGVILVGLKREWRFAELRAGEDGLQAVVVARGQRIELMVVTPGAAHGQAQERRDGMMGDVIEKQLPCYGGDADAGVLPRAHSQEARGDQALRVTGLPLVACDLFEYKLAVRLVLIEAADDVVAVAPGVGTLEVIGVAVGIGVTDDVEPVTRPALAVVWGCQ